MGVAMATAAARRFDNGSEFEMRTRFNALIGV